MSERLSAERKQKIWDRVAHNLVGASECREVLHELDALRADFATASESVRLLRELQVSLDAVTREREWYQRNYDEVCNALRTAIASSSLADENGSIKSIAVRAIRERDEARAALTTIAGTTDCLDTSPDEIAKHVIGFSGAYAMEREHSQRMTRERDKARHERDMYAAALRGEP